jgi:hypothetical protein
MQVNTSVHPEDIIISLRNTRPAMMVENKTRVVKDPKCLELMVTFYSGAPMAVFQTRTRTCYKVYMFFLNKNRMVILI